MNRRSWSPTGERLVSLGVQGEENEEDSGLLGQSTNVMKWGEEKSQKRYFCALTHGRAFTHITVSVDEAE